MSDKLETNKAIIRQFVDEVQNQQNIDAMDKFFSADFINYDIIAGLPDNLEGSKELHRILFRAFPDMKTVINDMAAEGNKVWTFKTVSGTHLNSLFDIPPTQQKISYRVIDIMTFRDKMIYEHWVVSDFSSLMQRLEACSMQST